MAMKKAKKAGKKSGKKSAKKSPAKKAAKKTTKKAVKKTVKKAAKKKTARKPNAAFIVMVGDGSSGIATGTHTEGAGAELIAHRIDGVVRPHPT